MTQPGRVRRIAVAWGAGIATTLVITVAAIVAAQAIPFEGDADHAGWLGVFVGLPCAALAGGYLAGRMAGSPTLPAGAWVLLNPAMAVCVSVMLLQALQHGIASEYFLELIGPSSLIIAVSLAGALWGRRRSMAAAEQ
jgi:hypothetical protein